MSSASIREELRDMGANRDRNMDYCFGPAHVPARVAIGTWRNFGDGSHGHWVPRGGTSSSTSSSSSLSSSSTVPIYDASGRDDILKRLRSLELSSAAPSLDGTWNAPVWRSDFDESLPYHSRHEWSPSRRRLAAATKSFPPSPGSIDEVEWQNFRGMPHGPVPVPEIPPGGAELFSARSETDSDPKLDLSLPAPRAWTGSQIPTPPKPWLTVFPEQLVNFSGRHVRFSVFVNDMPVHVPLSACTVEGVATTPSGIPIHCQMEELKKVNIYQLDVFTGIFTAPGESGPYKLRMKLTIPLGNSQLGTEDQLVIEDEMQLLVSRNYFRASIQQSTKSFLVDFTPSWHYYPEGRLNWQTGGESGSRSLSKAWGLACDKLTNRFYYADRNDHSLSCLDSEGRLIFKIPHGGPGSRPLFNRPTGICCDEVHRRLIVADKDGHAISFLSMDGEWLATFGGGGHGIGQFNYPWDVAISPSGAHIAVTDSRNKRAQLFDRNGNFLNKFSVFEQNPYEYKKCFDYPRGITFSKDGNSVFVTDFSVNNILEIPICMTMYRKLLPDGKLDRPQGIVSDEMGNLLVCDSKNGCIRHVHQGSGQILASIQSVGPERLHFPVNLTLMGDGRVAVLDTQGKIRIF